MVSLFFSYLWWHYTEALSNIRKLFGNFLWFFYNLFSIPILARTLFAPWQKLAEKYKGGFDIQNLFESFLVTSIMRIVGFFIRIVVIVTGLAALVLTFILGIAFFFIWLLVPVALIVFIFEGIRLLI